jgi:hypothetical protein
MTEDLAGEPSELLEQVAFTLLELARLGGRSDTECPARLRPKVNRRRGRAVQSQTPGNRHAASDQVRVRARSSHRRQSRARTGRAHEDPRLVEGEHGPGMVCQALENDSRVPQLLRRRDRQQPGGGISAPRANAPVAARRDGQEREHEEIREQAQGHPPCEHV